MDLSFTEQQTMLKTMATDFLGRELPKERVLEIDESPTGFAPDLWKQMADLGWTGMAIPEEYEGLGTNFTDLGALYEVLGAYACSSPHLSSVVLSAQVILELGDEAQKKMLLPPIARGEQIFSFAYTEPDYGWGPESVQLRAAARDGGFVLNGTKLFVPDAHIADRLLIVARTSSRGAPERGLTVFLVDKQTPGLSVRLLTGWIGDKLCEVALSNVKVPASAVIGTVGQAWEGIERAEDRATAVLCTYMAGGTQKATDMAADYSKTRIAFGNPIGTFQRVQDHVITGLNEADSIKWTAYEALWKLDEGRQDASAAVSMAKAVASIGFPRACDASHHVHGGIGTDLTFGLTNHTKRARTFQHYLGDAAFHKKRLAKLLKL